MRHPKRVVPKQPITHLWERQKEIARRLVAGDRQIDIARDYNMTPGRISIICNSPIFKNYLASLAVRREEKACDIGERIKKGADRGVDVLVEILDNKEAHISLKAKVAMDLLDREGHGKVTKVQTEITHHLTGSRIEELKRAREEKLKGLTYAGGPVIEAQLA